MGLNSHERFENHMDVSNIEMTNDIKRAEDVLEDVENIYDDLFEKRLTQASEYKKSKSIIEKDEEHSRKPSINIKSDAHLEENENSNPIKQVSGDIVFKGKAKENIQYGEGGGTQYFIRDFGNMKRDGRMNRADEQKLEYMEFLIEGTTKSKIIEKQKYKYDYNIDTNPLSDEEKMEWDKLEEETRDEQGLSRIMPNIELQIIEDRQNPWSDQENSGGSFFPDAYSNPYELQTGDTYYQLRPVDAKYDSSYVTDKKTVDACRGKDGKVDVAELLQKLQVKPSSMCEYILTQYVYQSGEKSNKIRD